MNLEFSQQSEIRINMEPVIDGLLRRYSVFDSGCGDENSQRAEFCETNLFAISSGLFRIVVMGEVKKGKSTFVNTLLGEVGLLPTDVDIATSTIFKVVYGSERRCTVFFNEGLKQAPLQIDFSEIETYGTEGGNPSNEKQVDFIAVELPIPFLKQGVTLTDTPGVGGLFRRHRGITFKHAPNADLIIFVVDSVESVLSKDEILFLKELRRQNPYIVFVQTKTDMVPTHDVTAIKERNLQILSESLECEVKNIPYFCVSARLKEVADASKSLTDLDASGFAEFLTCFNQAILPARKHILLNRLFPAIQSRVQQDRMLAEDRLKIAREAAASNKPLLEQYDLELKELLRRFENWRQEEWPVQYREFRAAVGRLERDSLKKIEQVSSIDYYGNAILESVKGNCKKPEDVQAHQEAALSELAARSNEDLNRILAEFESAVANLLGDLTNNSLESLQRISSQMLVSITPRTARDIDTTTNRTVREAYLGNMHWQGIGRKAAAIGGIALATLVTGGLLPLAMAKVALITGGVAISGNELWGYVTGFKISRERQVKDAIRALEVAMQETCQIANRTGRNSFSELAAELRDACEQATFDFQRDYKKSVDTRRSEIDAAMKRTAAESQHEIEKRLNEFKTIDKLGREFELLGTQLRV